VTLHLPDRGCQDLARPQTRFWDTEKRGGSAPNFKSPQAAAQGEAASVVQK